MLIRFRLEIGLKQLATWNPGYRLHGRVRVVKFLFVFAKRNSRQHLCYICSFTVRCGN